MSNLEKFETVTDESKRGCLVRKQFDYISKQMKAEKVILRVKFLERCVQSKLIQMFLQKFHFPKIEAYDTYKIERFQRKILKDELDKAKKVLLEKERTAKEFRNMFWELIPHEIVKEEVDRKMYNKITTEIEKLGLKHNRKLMHLSEQQGKPLFETNKKAYTLCDLKETPPDFVLNTISKGPRHPVRKKLINRVF